MNELTKETMQKRALEAQGKDIDFSNISSGVIYLAGGYVEYASEVITNRALVNVYDGLKPVNRRVVVILFYDKKTKGFVKCARLAGNVLALHPHGDAAVYAALVLMTDKNGSLAFPLLEGSGNFGGVYKDDPPAASRYTEAKLHMLSEELFGEMNGVNMIPNFDSTMEEPEVLPVSFPLVLVNSTSGIAVGFGSRMPSFNFVDVCNLVTEYIDKGHCETVICPDFVTGGYYIKNDKELQKLMRTGSAKLKLRGKATVSGKEIHVTEVPFGKTIQGLIKQIVDKNIPSIRNAYDTDDFEHGCGFTVDCTNKTRVQEAMYALYKDTDFQYSYSADMTVVKDGVPVKMGVWDIIKTWVEWRKKVLEKEYTVRIESCKARMRESEIFMNVINSPHKQALIQEITTKGKDAGKVFIRAHFTEDLVPYDMVDFVCNRAISAYHKGGKYAEDYASAKTELAQLDKNLADLGAVIKKQMQNLIKKYGSLFKRKTEITNVDYEFAEEDKSTNTQIKDDSVYFYTVDKNFVRKSIVSTGKGQFEMTGKTDDVILCLDNRGRLIRIYCEDLPLQSAVDMGTYIPRICNFEETDDYKITYATVIKGQKLMLLYKDGTVGHIDTNEWADNNRKVKVLEKGISPVSAPLLGAVFNVDKLPEYIMLADDKGRVGYFKPSELKVKHRTARTRAVTVTGEHLIDSYAFINNNFELMRTIKDIDKHRDRMCILSKGGFIGDVGIFKMI